MKQPGYYRQNPADYHDSRAQIAPGLHPRNDPVFSRNSGIFAIIFVLLPGLAFTLAQDSFANAISPTSQPSPADARIAALIEQLRSDNPAIRLSGAVTLTRLGAEARPAILKLTKSPDPGLAQQAAQILLNLPWYTKDDPPAVQRILQQDYGSPDIDVRRNVVGELCLLPDGQAFPALARLLVEDPSPAVQWTIVTDLREHDGLDLFRTMNPAADNSRSLAICGYAQLATRLPRAMENLRQCAELEFAQPTDDDGEFDMVIRLLSQAACNEKHFDQAADWRRKELARGTEADQEGIPAALLELFALHADYGPITGFEDDMRLAGDDLQKPKLQYCLSHMYRRNNDNARADAAQQAAFAGSTNRIQHYDVGEFVYDHGWDAFAEAELNAFLKSDDGNPVAGGLDMSATEANVLFRLSELAVKRGDDYTAARNKEHAMQLLPDRTTLDMEDTDGHHWQVPASVIWAQVYWRYLRAADAKHDEKEIDRRLEQILQLKPEDADIAIDTVPILRARGRTIDANLMFKWAYDPMKRKLNADPQNPENLNGLAWLCAKCDHDLPDALAWATRASDMMPNNAAIMDTLAEVNFHLGHYDKAVELETRASNLQPDDSFMKQQLERFKAAASNNPTARPH